MAFHGKTMWTPMEFHGNPPVFMEEFHGNSFHGIPWHSKASGGFHRCGMLWTSTALRGILYRTPWNLGGPHKGSSKHSAEHGTFHAINNQKARCRSRLFLHPARHAIGTRLHVHTYMQPQVFELFEKHANFHGVSYDEGSTGVSREFHACMCSRLVRREMPS